MGSSVVYNRALRPKVYQTRLFKNKRKIMKTEPIHRTSMWNLEVEVLPPAALIPAAVRINYVAKALAEG